MSETALTSATIAAWLEESEQDARESIARKMRMVADSHEALRERAEQAETERTRATMYLYNNHKDIWYELEEHISGLEAALPA